MTDLATILTSKIENEEQRHIVSMARWSLIDRVLQGSPILTTEERSARETYENLLDDYDDRVAAAMTPEQRQKHPSLTIPGYVMAETPTAPHSTPHDETSRTANFTEMRSIMGDPSVVHYGFFVWDENEISILLCKPTDQGSGSPIYDRDDPPVTCPVCLALGEVYEAAARGHLSPPIT